MKCLTMDTNVPGRATSQYKKFNYNSMTNFDGRLLGANSAGLFLLEGLKDNGTRIDAWIKTGMTDLGIQASKHLRKIYLGIETDADLEIELYADEEHAYTLPIKKKKNGQQTVRVSVGSDKKGVYWSFLVRNKKGAHFSIDVMEALPIVRHRGHL